MKKSFAIYLSVILVGLSLCGLAYSCRSAAAQRMYYRAKYTPDGADPANVLRLCDSASRLYPQNYYFCILAAERAYYSSFSMTGEVAAASIDEAQRWCDAGLGLNPYRVQLRRLKACLVARRSPAEAARYWETYVDWQYWEASNHALLVELYSYTGEYEKALDSLALIKGSPYYAEASTKLHEAWRKDRELPAGLAERRTKSAPH